MNFVNLDQTTRRYMLQEVESDAKVGRLYYSRRLTKIGNDDYEGLLREALEHYDQQLLADQLNAQGRMSSAEFSRSKKALHSSNALLSEIMKLLPSANSTVSTFAASVPEL